MSYHDSRDRHPLPTHNFRSESGYSSPAPGSGAQTPTGSGAGSSQSPGLVSSILGGLYRRFSAETPSLTHSSHSYPADSSHSHAHNNTTNNGVDGVYVPPRFSETIHRAVSPMQPPPLEPVQLRGFAPDTPLSARILSQAIAEEIRIMVPTRLSIVDEWNLIYSLDQDGASLATLYDKCAKYSGRRVGFVLVIKDAKGGVSHSLVLPSLFSYRNPASKRNITHTTMPDTYLVSPPKIRFLAPTYPTTPTQHPNTLERANVSSGAPPSWPPSRHLPLPTPRTCAVEHPPSPLSELPQT